MTQKATVYGYHRNIGFVMSVLLCVRCLARPQTVLNLETGWADILTVDSLTLLCDVDDKHFPWNYTWYKDGVEIANSTQCDLHMKATSENYKSEYRCQGIRSSRPTYSMLSEAFIANNIGKRG